MDLRPTANGASPRGHISHKIDTPNRLQRRDHCSFGVIGASFRIGAWSFGASCMNLGPRARGSKLVGGRSKNPATPKMSHVLGYSSGSWPLECLFARQSWLSASHEVVSLPLIIDGTQRDCTMEQLDNAKRGQRCDINPEERGP